MTLETVARPQSLDLPAKLSGYIWRAARREDASAIQRMAAADMKVDRLEAPLTLEEIERGFDQLGEAAVTDTLVALTAEGDVVAYAIFFLPPTEGEHRVQATGSVRADHRGQGIGSFLLKWLERRARQRCAEFNDGLPCVIQMGCRDYMLDRISLFEKQGFRPARYFYKMQRELSHSMPDRPLAEGLRAVVWRPELDAATMDAFNDSFRDHWGFYRVDQEIWQRWFTGKPDFRGDLSYLAVDEDDNVVGFCLSAVKPEEIAETGVQEAWMDEIGVIGGWRKRGIASALMVMAMQAYQAAGLDYAVLGVDMENPTGALGLYEGLGFVSVRRQISFVKPLT
jgi:ribosomal protein S18 acetylase RimI-like enzyme